MDTKNIPSSVFLFKIGFLFFKFCLLGISFKTCAFLIFSVRDNCREGEDKIQDINAELSQMVLPISDVFELATLYFMTI